MAITKFKEVFVGEVELTDLDAVYPFYNEQEEDFNEIEYEDPTLMKYASHIPSACIDFVIDTLMTLKDKGAERVYIADHNDNRGYYFYGVKFEEK